MKRYTYIPLIFCLMLLVSCVQTLENDSFDFDQKMVLYCVFEPEKPWTLRLSSSQNVFDQQDTIKFIENANIELYEGEGFAKKDFSYLGEGWYVLPGHYPVSGKHYTIRVKHEDYPTLHASSSIPDNFSLYILKREVKTVDNNQMLSIDCAYQSFDNEIKNIVVENDLSRTYNTNGDTIVVEEQDILQHQFNADIVDRFLPLNSIEYKLCFTFPESEMNFGFYSLNGFKKSGDSQLIVGQSVFQFYRASDEYYHYVKSLELYRSNKNKFVSSIVPPVEIYSNVADGLGIFAGRNTFTYQYLFN